MGELETFEAAGVPGVHGESPGDWQYHAGHQNDLLS